MRLPPWPGWRAAAWLCAGWLLNEALDAVGFEVFDHLLRTFL